jgi:hypothetical protein
MRGVTILATVMGIMLIVGTAVLIAVIIGRIKHHPVSPVARPYLAAPITIPHGARIATMMTDAGRLIVDLALPRGDHELVVINLATGARIGTIALHAAP